MGLGAERWMLDSCGEDVQLRPDPEGEWRHRRSFQLDWGQRAKLTMKNPRVAFVLALRELNTLEFRPDSRRDVLLMLTWHVILGVVCGAMLYAMILRDFFGDWNWVAITITLLCSVIGFLVVLWWTWRKGDRRYRELCAVLRQTPPHCGGCWYPLGEWMEEDGCTVCPECGAAWRIHEVVGTAAQV